MRTCMCYCWTLAGWLQLWIDANCWRVQPNHVQVWSYELQVDQADYNQSAKQKTNKLWVNTCTLENLLASKKSASVCICKLNMRRLPYHIYIIYNIKIFKNWYQQSSWMQNIMQILMTWMLFTCQTSVSKVLEKLSHLSKPKPNLRKQQRSPSICLIKLTFSKFSRFTMEDAKPIRGKNRMKTLEQLSFSRQWFHEKV